MRDNFTKNVKETLAKRVAYLCSNPECSCLTIGPKKENKGSITIGVASHITAASPEGPRYENDLTKQERVSYENGIWLCQNCSKIIDSNPEKHTKELLCQWKEQAEQRASDTIGKNFKMKV